MRAMTGGGQRQCDRYCYLCLLLCFYLVRATPIKSFAEVGGSTGTGAHQLPLACGFRDQGRGRGRGRDRCHLLVATKFPPRGGSDNEVYGSDEGEEEEEEDFAHLTEDYRGPLPPSISRKKNRRRRKSTLQSLAEKSVKLTTKTALATAKQSGKAAYYLVKPKHVEKRELVGLWRMDQQVLLSSRNAIPMECCANIELTPHSVLVTMYDENSSGEKDEARILETPWKFTPAQWPRAAKVEFAARAFLVEGHRQQLFFYKGQVDRKLAARSVIKIKGKIYRIEKTGWRGKNYKHVAIGTFVARRRLKFEEDDEWGEDEENEESDWESDENYEDGVDGDLKVGEDEQSDGYGGEIESESNF